MNTTFTAIIKKDGPWWIGWIEEVSGVNAQEETMEKLLSSLREILSEALEFNRSEARQAAEKDYTEEFVTVRSVAYSSSTSKNTDARSFGKVGIIPGGATCPRTDDHPFPGTLKFTTCWLERFARIWTFPSREKHKAHRLVQLIAGP